MIVWSSCSVINQNSSFPGNYWPTTSPALTISIIQSGGSIIDNLDFNLVDVDMESLGNYSYKLRSILINVSNNNNSQLLVNTSWTMTDSVTNFNETSSVSVPANSNTNKQLVNPTSYPNGKTYESANDEPRLRITISYGASSKSKLFIYNGDTWEEQ